jgi:hypothetical protein
MGGQGSGPRFGVPRGEYFTARRRRELQLWQIEQERQIADAKAIRKERARVRALERAKLRRIARKSAGLPNRRGGKDRPGASTPRVQRWRERRRTEQAAAEAVLQEAKQLERARRNREKTARYRQRRAERRATYLISQWWSPEVSEEGARALLRAQRPNLDDLAIQTAYQKLLFQARFVSLSVNAFTIGTDDTDGIAYAREQRAIFHELSQMNRRDLLVVLREAEAVKSLSDLEEFASLNSNPTHQRNMMMKAIDHAQLARGSGSDIYNAVLARDR